MKYDLDVIQTCCITILKELPSSSSYNGQEAVLLLFPYAYVVLVNRPGVAGAVLQTPSSLIDY